MRTVSGRMRLRNTMGYSTILDTARKSYPLSVQELWDVHELRQEKEGRWGWMCEGLVPRLVLRWMLSGRSVQLLRYAWLFSITHTATDDADNIFHQLHFCSSLCIAMWCDEWLCLFLICELCIHFDLHVNAGLNSEKLDWLDLLNA
jgi:hypothetical protein